MNSNCFETLILIARPAAGKSEIIHYLKGKQPQERLERFHIGQISEIDDFPMLWTWFEEDDLLEEMGHERLHTTPEGYFRWRYLWDLLIRRINLEHKKRRRDYNEDTGAVTTLVEFARGKEHGGFRQAFQNLSGEILQRGAILYIRVSYEESLRKNRRRFNPERPDSILEHGLSDEKMERLYAEVDWDEISDGRSEGTLEIQNCQVPFVVFDNQDDVTTQGGEALGVRLEAVLNRLWDLYVKS